MPAIKINADNLVTEVAYDPQYYTPQMILVDHIPPCEGILRYVEGAFTCQRVDDTPPTETQTPITNADIRLLREQAYRTESDSLYIAWQKYVVLQADNAVQARLLWLEKVSEIDKRYPYMD